MELKTITGKNVHYLRTKHHITQQDLASRSGLSISYIRNIEHGNGNISLEIIQRISSVFGIYPFSLLMPDLRLPADWSEDQNLNNLPKE